VDAIPDLVRALDHPDPNLRYTLAGAISTCAGDRFNEDELAVKMPDAALSALVTLAQDEDADVRYSALYELSSWWKEVGLVDPRAEATLRAGLTDEDDGVRATCAEAFEPTEE